ncbi:hypothetical protein B0I35DRAFT_256256 [Stachybotrys elegans]|uniref:Uncharacterized protein n=1 Tax=Stachybotrys elegans TaxID=80388 RepID=A0A8K0SPN3_9HYPO|nr:hypothetical protein B0I35DRAFT_256256 [Stachybotrys elegans]
MAEPATWVDYQPYTEGITTANAARIFERFHWDRNVAFDESAKITDLVRKGGQAWIPEYASLFKGATESFLHALTMAKEIIEETVQSPCGDGRCSYKAIWPELHSSSSELVRAIDGLAEHLAEMKQLETSLRRSEEHRNAVAYDAAFDAAEKHHRAQAEQDRKDREKEERAREWRFADTAQCLKDLHMEKFELKEQLLALQRANKGLQTDYAMIFSQLRVAESRLARDAEQVHEAARIIAEREKEMLDGTSSKTAPSHILSTLSENNRVNLRDELVEADASETESVAVSAAHVKEQVDGESEGDGSGGLWAKDTLIPDPDDRLAPGSLQGVRKVSTSNVEEVVSDGVNKKKAGCQPKTVLLWPKAPNAAVEQLTAWKHVLAYLLVLWYQPIQLMVQLGYLLCGRGAEFTEVVLPAMPLHSFIVVLRQVMTVVTIHTWIALWTERQIWLRANWMTAAYFRSWLLRDPTSWYGPGVDYGLAWWMPHLRKLWFMIMLTLDVWLTKLGPVVAELFGA